VERLPQALVKAEAVLDKAGEAYDKEWEAYVKASAAFGKEWEAHKPEIAKLHTELCPNCPWDGETIFSATK
jgi:hypothetical protein